MSTMLPDEMLGGRRMEGNSIYKDKGFVSAAGRDKETANRAHQTLIRRQKDGNAGVDLADGEGDEHGSRSRSRMRANQGDDNDDREGWRWGTARGGGRDRCTLGMKQGYRTRTADMRQLAIDVRKGRAWVEERRLVIVRQRWNY